MPTIYIYFGFSFSFYANDHLPIHLHVKKAERVSICIIIYEDGSLVLKWRKAAPFENLTNTEKKEAENFIKKHHLQIVQKWNQFYMFNKRISPEKVNVRIK